MTNTNFHDQNTTIATAMPFDEYKDLDAINASGLKLISAQSPLHYWDEYINPKRPQRKVTPALNMGTALHALVLEHEVIWRKAPDVPKRSNKDKQTWKEHEESLLPGEVSLKAVEIAQVELMANSVRNHKVAARYLYDKASQPLTEFTIQWDCAGTACKSRIDMLRRHPKKNEILIIDLKTTRDASPRGFRKAVTDFKYHLQAAFYMDAVKAYFGNRYGTDTKYRFIFVAVENTRPYATGVYECSIGTMKQGAREYTQALQLYDACKMWNSWPGYNRNHKVDEVRLPMYARDYLYDDAEEEVENEYDEQLENVLKI